LKEKQKVVKQQAKPVTESTKMCREVKWEILLEIIGILLHVCYPLMIRVSLTQDGTRNLVFNSNFFYKYPDGNNPFAKRNNLTSATYLRELSACVRNVI